ncbi:hypothetical protein CVT26_003303 [Gymnopilus dilepis]|uniref:Uncharacterized protein n=1 Tax=Gymnopilus dilepis TaxID=231916 RepID=A0A409Y4W8_9AGAR|nr:hypothetical protein CVT26_003303 [Gymnopilus dilepis]
MPVATPATPSRASEASNSGTKLRSSTPEEIELWSEKVDRRSCLLDIYDLDEAIDYPFRDGDSVWVKTKEENWCQGRVVGRSIRVGQTRRQKQGFYYPVNFGTKSNIRKYFAPLNGEIKPDIRVVRHLLLQDGWIDDEENAANSDSSGDLYEDDD